MSRSLRLTAEVTAAATVAAAFTAFGPGAATLPEGPRHVAAAAYSNGGESDNCQQGLKLSRPLGHTAGHDTIYRDTGCDPVIVGGHNRKEEDVIEPGDLFAAICVNAGTSEIYPTLRVMAIVGGDSIFPKGATGEALILPEAMSSAQSSNPGLRNC